MADTTQAWLDYFKQSGYRLTPERQRYAEAYGQLGTPPPAVQDPNTYLSGEQKNAFEALRAVFSEYGLADLTGDILGFIRDGYDQSTIALMLRETDSYKQRFKANDVRQKAGLSTLSPAEYIALERQYAQVMRAAGMPSGFYDSVEDFTNWIANDVSVNEVNQRVAAAQKAAFDAPQDVRDQMQRLYGVGPSDIAAYFLDENRALPLLESRANAAAVAAGAQRSGFGLDAAKAENLGAMGVDARTAQQGYAQIADVLPTAGKLSDIYGDAGRYDLAAAEADVFGTAGADRAQATRKKLASAERSAFSGSTGTTRGSLGTNRKGSV